MFRKQSGRFLHQYCPMTNSIRIRFVIKRWCVVLFSSTSYSLIDQNRFYVVLCSLLQFDRRKYRHWESATSGAEKHRTLIKFSVVSGSLALCLVEEKAYLPFKYLFNNEQNGMKCLFSWWNSRCTAVFFSNRWISQKIDCRSGSNERETIDWGSSWSTVLIRQIFLRPIPLAMKKLIGCKATPWFDLLLSSPIRFSRRMNAFTSVATQWTERSSDQWHRSSEVL